MSELSTVEGGSARYPIPEGYATPTVFTQILRTRNITTSLSPQRIYGFIADRKQQFPYNINEDGRKIVPVEQAIHWVVAFLQRRAEDDAKRAAKTAREAELALAALSSDTVDFPEIDEWDEVPQTELEPVDEWPEDFKA